MATTLVGNDYVREPVIGGTPNTIQFNAELPQPLQPNHDHHVRVADLTAFEPDGV
jgi:hypothetical protein